MRQADALSRINAFKPDFVDEFEKLGIKLKYSSQGAYRHVYTTTNVSPPLIVKEPNQDGDDDVVQQRFEHAYEEYKTWKRIRKISGYYKLRKYMPEFHYFSKGTGLIVMRKYRMLSGKNADWIRILLDDLIGTIYRPAKGYSVDVDNSGNVGVDKDGTPIILDLGMFSSGF